MRRTDRHSLLVVVLALPLFASCSGQDAATITLTSVAPEHASARGGEKITLEGHGFGAAPTVRFGDAEVAITSATDTRIEIVSPEAIAGVVAVEVTADDRHARLDAALTFDALPLTFVDVAWQQLPPLAVDGGRVAVADGTIYQAARHEGVWAYAGDGKGSFADPILVRPGPGPDTDTDPATDPLDVGSVVAADLDGDGMVDLFLGATSTTKSRILSGHDKLVFTSSKDALPALFGADQTAIAVDLDEDGDLDLVTVGTATSVDGPAGVGILLNDGSGRFTDVTAERLPGGSFAAAGVAAGDVDGNGHVDLFFAGDKASSRLYLNDGHGVFQRSAPDALPKDDAPGAGIPAFGDLDGNGTLDIYLPSAARDRVLSNEGTGHFVDVTELRLGADVSAGRSAIISDLDLDGHADVVVVDRPGRVRLLHNDGSGRLFDYSAEVAGNTTAQLNAGAALADVDGDGDLDLFVSRAGFARAALFVNWSPSVVEDADEDGDRFPDAVDSCPSVPNPDQANVDSLPFRCESAAACQAQTTCDLHAFGASAYLVCGGVKATWADASAACEARGAHLVTIADADENAFLLSLGVADAWIGFSDTIAKGTYAWVAGESTYVNWGTMQPDDAGGNEDCAVFLADGTWNDAICAQTRGYVCQDVRSRAPDPGDACDACTTKYEPGSAPVTPSEAGTCGSMKDADAGAP